MNMVGFVASGAVLYVILGFGAAVLLLLIWKWPLVLSWVMWPFKWVGNKIFASSVGKWVASTWAWRWLEKQQYDPPAKPLTWWVSRGLVVLFFWAVISAVVWTHGRKTGRMEVAATVAPVQGAFMDKDAEGWRNEFRKCSAELDAARVPEVKPLTILDAPVIVSAPPAVKVQPLKQFRTVCKPDWLCAVDKKIGIGK